MKVENIQRITLHQNDPNDKDFIEGLQNKEEYKCVFNGGFTLGDDRIIFEKSEEVEPIHISMDNVIREAFPDINSMKSEDIRCGEALKTILNKYKVPSSCYSLLELKEDAYCIIHENDKYKLISYEKGKKYIIDVYDSYYDACFNLILKILPEETKGRAESDFVTEYLTLIL